MGLPKVPVTPGTGLQINTLQDAGQTTSANSHPVVVALDQPTIPVINTSSNIATSQVTVGTAATLILAARVGRGEVIIESIGGAAAVFIGPAGVTVANGLRIPAVDSASLSITTGAAIYGIVASGSQVVSTIETY